MAFISRIARLMTQLNIGATLATAAWVIHSGLAVVAPDSAPSTLPVPASGTRPSSPPEALHLHPLPAGQAGHPHSHPVTPRAWPSTQALRA